eukprot:scaffold11235_cov98-Isochrysis_galbana.AAC.5
MAMGTICIMHDAHVHTVLVLGQLSLGYPQLPQGYRSSHNSSGTSAHARSSNRAHTPGPNVAGTMVSQSVGSAGRGSRSVQVASGSSVNGVSCSTYQDEPSAATAPSGANRSDRREKAPAPTVVGTASPPEAWAPRAEAFRRSGRRGGAELRST